MFELVPPVDDGLFIPEVRSWSSQKHHFLRRYIDAFTTAMEKKPWSGLHYIDLFANAGIERIKETGDLDWGSPLIAAQAPIRFARLHLCELQKKRFIALCDRVNRFSQPNPPQIIQGDANVAAADVIETIPEKALSLAFLDPYGLHLEFETLRVLSRRRVDFIIFFPDHVDALRNWENVYAGKPDSNLDLVLNGARWLEQMLSLPRERWAESLRDIYVEQIRGLGYEHFEFERISRTDGVPLYQLIFCSRHKLGADIWRRTSLRKKGGQGTFDFR